MTEIILDNTQSGVNLLSEYPKGKGITRWKKIGKKMSCYQMAYYRGIVLPHLHSLYEDSQGKISMEVYHTMLKSLKWPYTVHSFGKSAILSCDVSLSDVNEVEMIDFIETLEYYCFERFECCLPEPRRRKINVTTKET